MTKGEYRVGIDFNPSGDQLVKDIKAAAAALIDMIDEVDAPARTDNINIGEIMRLKALAMTAIEEGAMWAVKAATKGPMEDPLALAKSMDDPNYQDLVEEPKEE